ncbi:MAG TPA: exosortase H [Chromatiaceae bacterium]|nr:exosortase H [Chromatiaceae bacterium]
MLRFFFIFLAIQAALFTAELTRPVQQVIVIPFTESIASLSVWLVKLFDEGVIAYGNIIRDQQSGFAVAIEAGCNGVEATIVLVAAMLAMPAPWKLKLIGIGTGFVAIQAMNLLRIISLFYLGQWNKTAFDWAHLYIWQALIMLDVLIVFLIWLRFLPARQQPAHAS